MGLFFSFFAILHYVYLTFWILLGRRPARHLDHGSKISVWEDRTSAAEGRWCKLLIIAPPHHKLNETPSYFLGELMMLPSSHVHNHAQCSIVWRAKFPQIRFSINDFRVLLASLVPIGTLVFFENFFVYCRKCFLKYWNNRAKRLAVSPIRD